MSQVDPRTDLKMTKRGELAVLILGDMKQQMDERNLTIDQAYATVEEVFSGHSGNIVDLCDTADILVAAGVIEILPASKIPSLPRDYSGDKQSGCKDPMLIKLIFAIKAADNAFWRVIADEFPEIKTGDFSPEQTASWHKAVVNAVAGWITNNSENGIEISSDDIDQILRVM